MEQWIRFWAALWIGSEKLTRRTVDWLCNATPKPPNKHSGGAPDDTGEQPEEAPGEQPAKPKKAAAPRQPASTEGSALLRWVGLALSFALVKATPYTTAAALAAAAAWLVTALALGYLATTPPEKKEPAPEKPSADDGQEQHEKPAADARHPSELLPLEHVAVLLHGAYTEGSGVHLAHLAETLTTTPLMGLPATPWKTGHVRTLLTRHKVRVKPGVRVPPLGVREGVHRNDFPPLPPTGAVPPVVGDVAAGQSNNNNDHNTTPPPFQVVQDPANPHRHHIHHTR
ncbi:hypothetical protein NW249_34230 [Streptomyces sp. OUCMDZ-4982]|uniref:hypothetical protein n=1 Tax=Streptomyces sp. OUCMDZ-4982 TaxID=2973090 RepID=UPI00215B8B83|nr:hypothetical protein [Streptomyces sp. OUCMDZ-4982]MCR8947147.1 hypothetical protein [Streptomyces sp. OUCMDZ-4982]